MPDATLTFELGGSVGDAARGAENRAEDVLCVERRLSVLGFPCEPMDGRMSEETVWAIRLFQAAINGYSKVAGSGVDGVVDVNHATHQWLQVANAPEWVLMPIGNRRQGFINCERLDERDTHDYGTSWMAEAIIATAQTYLHDYLQAHPGTAPLAVNDVSLPRGGWTRDHDGHQTGLACDLRLPRKNGGVGGVRFDSDEYDASATRALLLALSAQPQVHHVFFNDPVLIAEELCRWAKGHPDHIHFEVKPPQRQL